MGTEVFLRNLWRWKCGLPEEDYIVAGRATLPDLDTIKKTQWSDEFENLMRNRLVMGAFRYGLIDGEKSKGYSHTSSITKRLELYEKTGNLETLVDIANLCLLEFLHSNHPNKHFESKDDGIHSKPKK